MVGWRHSCPSVFCYSNISYKPFGKSKTLFSNLFYINQRHNSIVNMFGKNKKRGQFDPGLLLRLGVILCLLLFVVGFLSVFTVRITADEVNDAKDDALTAAENTSLDAIQTNTIEGVDDVQKLPGYGVTLGVLAAVLVAIGGFVGYSYMR